MLRHRHAALAVLAFACAPVFAAECAAEIDGNDAMQFSKAAIEVSQSCKEFKVTLKHVGKLPRQAMGHNWTLVKTADLTAVANAGMGAGLEKDYVAPGDKRVIAYTKVIGGGQSTSITFPTSALKKGGDYSFVCTFPGHSALMKGKFVFG